MVIGVPCEVGAGTICKSDVTAPGPLGRTMLRATASAAAGRLAIIFSNAAIATPCEPRGREPPNDPALAL